MNSLGEIQVIKNQKNHSTGSEMGNGKFETGTESLLSAAQDVKG